MLLRNQLSNIINTETNNIIPADLVHIIIEYVSSIHVENLLSSGWETNRSIICIPNDITFCKYNGYAKKWNRHLRDIDGEFCHIPGIIERELHRRKHKNRIPLPLEYHNIIKNNIIIVYEKTKIIPYVNIKCSICEFYNSFPCNINYANEYKTLVIILDLYSLTLIIY